MIRPLTLLALSSLVPSLALAEDPLPVTECPSAVTVRRAHSDEIAALTLVRCDGSAELASLDELSILGRPTGTPRPAPEAVAVYQAQAPAERSARFVSPGIHRLDPGLLTRLQALATHFPGHALEIVSGYRPHARRGSRHRVGRALDVRVDGVDRKDVAEYARRTLEASGVGYYPNSTFTHIDVREQTHHWVDLSTPGQAPRYVAWSDEAAEATPSAGDVIDEPTAVSDEASDPVIASAPEPTPIAEAPVGAEAPVAVTAPVVSVAPDPQPAPELDDEGRPIDVGSLSEAVRSAVVNHQRQATLARQPGQPARDENIDWTVPWWSASRAATDQGRETSTSIE